MKKILFASLLVFLVCFFAFGDPNGTLLFAGNISRDGQVASKNLITTEGLRSAAIEADRKNSQNRDKIDSFLEIKQVQSKILSMGLTVDRVKKAVRTLTNAELAYLARQADTRQDVIVGGDDSDMYLLILLLVIVLVAAAYEGRGYY
jgi:hypothetical protein